MEIQVISGQIIFNSLTNKLAEKEYAIRKATCWIQMLNEGKNPVKWLKPSKKGTKVNFDFIHNEGQYHDGIKKMEEYLKEVNKKYDLDLKIVKR